MEKHPGNFDSSNKAQHNIPNLCNKYKRYEQSMTLQSTALILDNIGFSTASNSVINILSYLLRTYFEKLCRESKSSSEFANRDFVTLEDVSTMFIRHSIDLRELHDYLQQVGSFKLNEPPPLFPLPLSSYKTIVEKQEFENQKEDELTEKADINEKIQVNDDDNEQQDDIKQDHRGLQRFAQKSFPNFFGASASDLGITVKKFVPPLVEIFVEANFLKSTMIEDVSFSIMRPDFFSVPCLSLKGVPESERHKEKRRRKKEKREQQREFNGINEEKQPQFEREKLHETEGIEVKSPDHLKVPKIKIRIGPGPFSAAPLFDLQSTQQIISAGLHSQLPAIDESKIILTQLSTKTEVLQHSTSISTAPDKLKTTRCSSPVQKIILIDDQQTTTPSAKTPPSREDVKKGAKKRKRSPKRAFSLLVETTMKESSIPAIRQDQSSSATDMSQIKDEAKMPDIEKNKRKRNSPKRTSPSPPRRCIRATTPSSKEEVEIMDVNITPIQNNVKKTPALVPPKLLAETKPVPSSVSTVSNILTIPQKQTSSTSKQPKRSRKSEKPTRVDPSIISDVLTQEESPPPGPPPAPSKAMETILETSKKTEKFLEINKKVNKISDTSLKTPQTSIKKPPINLARLLKPSTASNPQNAAKTLSSGSTSKSKINDKITPVITKSKQKTQKTLTITKTVEKIKEVKNEEKVAVLNKINQSSSTENNFDDDQEEDVWICPVCSVAYVENGPDMVACDTCDRWFHWSCVGILIPPPDNASWYCNECKKKNKKNSGTNSGGNSSRKSSFGGNSNKKRIK